MIDHIKSAKFDNKYFNLKYTEVIGYIILFLLGFVLSSILVYCLDLLELDQKVFNSVFVFLNVIPFLIPIVYFFIQHGKNNKFTFKLTKEVYLLVPLTLLMMISISYLTTIIPHETGFLKEWYDAFAGGFESLMNPKWALVVATCIFAPIFEEIFLRGILLKGLINRATTEKEVWYAIVFTAFIFGIIHGNPWQFIAAFVAGIALGYVYYRTKSLGNTIFMHALNNGVSVYVLFEYGEMELAELEDFPAYYNILFLIGFIIMLYLVYFFTKNNFKENK